MNYTFTRKAFAATIIAASITIAPFAFAAPADHTNNKSDHHSNQTQLSFPTKHKGFGGTVTYINGTIITISSGKKGAQIYTVDASKARLEGSNIKTVTDIKVGDKLIVIGNATGTTIEATMLLDRPASMGISKAFALSHAPKNKSN